MVERETDRAERASLADGPRVGLASYDPSDPEATFRLVEPYQLRPAPRRAGLGTWALRLLLSWSLNVAALAVAGLVVSSVGASDPVPYVAWAAAFAAVGASVPAAALLLRRRRAVLVVAVALLCVDVALVQLMTELARPFHSPDPAGIAKAGAVMWLAGISLSLLYLRRRAPTAPRRPAQRP